MCHEPWLGRMYQFELLVKKVQKIYLIINFESMYNFVFWFFYKFFEWRKDFTSVFLASATVALAFVIHLMLMYSLLRYFTGFSFDTMDRSYIDRKLILLPFVLALFLIFYFGYYKLKSESILEKYKSVIFFKPLNIMYILLILAVPLLIAIKINFMINNTGN